MFKIEEVRTVTIGGREFYVRYDAALPDDEILVRNAATLSHLGDAIRAELRERLAGRERASQPAPSSTSPATARTPEPTPEVAPAAIEPPRPAPGSRRGPSAGPSDRPSGRSSTRLPAPLPEEARAMLAERERRREARRAKGMGHRGAVKLTPLGGTPEEFAAALATRGHVLPDDEYRALRAAVEGVPTAEVARLLGGLPLGRVRTFRRSAAIRLGFRPKDYSGTISASRRKYAPGATNSARVPRGDDPTTPTP